MSKMSRVEFWNKACGNTPKKPYSHEYWASLKSQALCLREEVEELLEAITNTDAVEVLDAQVDIQYVLEGLLYLTQHKHEEAYKRVCDNNDLKFTQDENLINQRLEDIQDRTGFPCEVRESFVEGFEDPFYAVVRSDTGKIMKQSELPKVDLTDLVNRDNMVYVPKKDGCSLCKSLIADLVSLGYEGQVLDVEMNMADAEFCDKNNLDYGQVLYYYNGVGHKIHYSQLNYSIHELRAWLNSHKTEQSKEVI